MTEENRTDFIAFCPMCFASDDGGSWGVGTIGDHCFNCGANGSIAVPRWATNAIRQSASWVGRRYYPGDEDREIDAERRALLATVKVFPGREVAPARQFVDGEWEPDPGRWEIGKGRQMMTSVQADSAEAAMEASRYLLRYIPDQTP